MDDLQVLPPWLARIEQRLDRHGRRGGFLLSLPDYRPELIDVVAGRLGLDLCDFRAEVMAPLAWRASALPLRALDRTIEERCHGRGLILHNAEALLATKPAADRRAWFDAHLARPGPGAALVPLVLFADDVVNAGDRLIAFGADQLPDPTLLIRLLSAR